MNFVRYYCFACMIVRDSNLKNLFALTINESVNVVKSNCKRLISENTKMANELMQSFLTYRISGIITTKV